MPMAMEGIRVVDLTTGQQGPVAAAMLADMGAEVLKIEQKDVGDPGRNVRTEVPGQEPFPLSYYFENNNRNKKGVALDYKSEAGRDVVYRLVETSDVFISNFAIPELKDLGFDYETLYTHNSNIIYAVATAWGPKGPDKDKPATGDTVQFYGGVLSHGNSDGPVPFWGGLAEQEDAILMAYGIVSALIARERYGIGQEVYSSMLGSQINWAALNVQGNLFNGVEPWGMRRDVPFSPVWNFYLTKDEKWIALGFLKEAKDWPDLCRTIEREDLEFDPRFDSNAKRTGENSQILLKILEEVFAERTLDEWTARMKRSDIAWSVLNNYDSLSRDEQVVANEYVVDFDHPKVGPVQMVGVPFRLLETPGGVRIPAPELGEHTDAVLAEVGGYSSDDLKDLKRTGVI